MLAATSSRRETRSWHVWRESTITVHFAPTSISFKAYFLYMGREPPEVMLAVNTRQAISRPPPALRAALALCSLGIHRASPAAFLLIPRSLPLATPAIPNLEAPPLRAQGSHHGNPCLLTPYWASYASAFSSWDAPANNTPCRMRASHCQV